MEKQILNIINIKNDISKKYSKRLLALLLGFGVVLVSLIFLIVANIRPNSIASVILFIIATATFFTLIGYIFFCVRIFNAIKHNKLIIEIDKLIPTQNAYLRFHRYLTFEKYGVYHVTKYERYNQFETNQSTFFMEQYNTSKPGDTFYIVSHNKKTILAFYNTKIFHYKEPTLNDLFDRK